MALSVTPTSGAAPYTLSIDLDNKRLIDGVRYDMEVRFQIGTGECPVPSGEPNFTVKDNLLNQGYNVRMNDVPNGQCLVYKVDIIDLETSAVISTQSVSVDNV